MEGRTSVFLINDTSDPVPCAIWEPVEPWQEVRDGTTWKRTEAASLGCGNIPPPEDLGAGQFLGFRVRDPMSGDVEGEIRYCIDPGGMKPLVTSGIQGRFSSRLFDMAGRSASEFELAVESDFRDGIRGNWKYCTIAKTPEQLVALLELVRESEEFCRLRSALSEWLKQRPDGGMKIASEEFARAMASISASRWGEGPDEQAFFRSALGALRQTDQPPGYGAPAKFREIVWTTFGMRRKSLRLGGINPERYERLQVIHQSGNPWGAGANEVSELLNLAEADLASESKATRNAAAGFLADSWMGEEIYPTDRYRALLRSEFPEGRKAGVLGLLGRKHRDETIKWLGEHYMSLGEHLLPVWNRLQDRDRPLEEWELPIAAHLLEIRPLSTVVSLRPRCELDGRGLKGDLPIPLRIPIRSYLLNEAREKSVTGPQPDSLGKGRRRVWTVSLENNPNFVATALAVLAHWNNEDDTDLIRAFLDHPGASYTPETKTTERKRYVVRKAAARLLEARKEIVSEDVVFEEIVPLLPVERE